MPDEGATIRAREREELRNQVRHIIADKRGERGRDIAEELECATDMLGRLTIAVCNVGEEISAASPRRDSFLNVG